MRPPERSTPDLHRVLVCIDPSANATAALDVAVRLARSTHATATLLAVAPLATVPTDEPAFGVPMQEPQNQHLLDRLAQERVDDVAAGLGSGLDVRTRLGWGSAGRAIVEEAAEGAYDLVIIPWHQNGPSGRVLHEHNHAARHVLDHCPIPVVLVPAGRAEPAR